MDKKGKIALMFAIFIVGILVIGMVMAAPPTKHCKDGIDNDGDGLTDLNDPGCTNKNDKSELNPNVECDDGLDNDGDSAIDYNDNGCLGPTDNDETDCGDGVCEGGETSGTCPADCVVPDSCSDTDGGNYPLIFGTTSGYYNNNLYSNDDYCVDLSNIIEYYCSGDYESSQQQSCGNDGYGSNYCMNSSVYRYYNDYYCSGEACSYSSTPEFVETCEYGCTAGACDPVPDSCSDTDGGFIEWLFGAVSGFFGGSPYSNADFCVDNTNLVERYCSGNYAYSWNVSCTGNYTGCASGACY